MVAGYTGGCQRDVLNRGKNMTDKLNKRVKFNRAGMQMAATHPILEELVSRGCNISSGETDSR